MILPICTNKEGKITHTFTQSTSYVASSSPSFRGKPGFFSKKSGLLFPVLSPHLAKKFYLRKLLGKRIIHINLKIMKKRSFTLLVAATVASSVLFSSCIGSFGLTNKLLSWNRSIDSKFVNELVFIAFCIVPVYEISAIADILVINSIEFWSGNNPVADVGNIRTIEGKEGIYTVETKTDGYHIQKQGEETAVDLVYNEADQSWSVKTNGESSKLMRFNGDNEVVMYLPDGGEMNVELSQAGVWAFQQAAATHSYFASK